ncbi:MAG: type 4a pilus biogenesis protein PilO [Candidatus Omnitrophota bacterium]
MIDFKKIYAFFSHLSRREKIIFYVALGFFVLTILDRLIIYPVLSKVRSLSEEIREEKAQIKKDLHILAQKERVIEESKKYARYSIQDLSTEEVTTSLLKEIGDLANKTGVYLLDIKPTGVKEGTVFRKYYVSLSCEAQMEQIINFMYSLESSNSLLRVEKYNISPKSEGSSIARCSMIIVKTAIP